MTQPPLGITFREGTRSIAVHTQVRLPQHWKKDVKEGLDQDMRLGNIEQVPAATPTIWLIRMVVAPKSDESHAGWLPCRWPTTPP